MLFKDTVFVITEVEHIGYLGDQLHIFLVNWNTNFHSSSKCMQWITEESKIHACACKPLHMFDFSMANMLLHSLKDVIYNYMYYMRLMHMGGCCSTCPWYCTCKSVAHTKDVKSNMGQCTYGYDLCATIPKIGSNIVFDGAVLCFCRSTILRRVAGWSWVH